MKNKYRYEPSRSGSEYEYEVFMVVDAIKGVRLVPIAVCPNEDSAILISAGLNVVEKIKEVIEA
jgi:hypothetical protein